MTYGEMAEFLRCSIDNKGKCNLDCPYCLKEVIRPDFPLPVDVIIDGVGYWLNCDCNRMTEDVIKILEAMEE